MIRHKHRVLTGILCIFMLLTSAFPINAEQLNESADDFAADVYDDVDNALSYTSESQDETDGMQLLAADSGDDSSSGGSLIGDIVKDEDQYIFEDTRHMSNEEFFGEWDEDTETWIQTPRLNYDLTAYDDTASVMLKSVGESAKNGDYESAEQGILDYYRYIERFFPRTNRGGNGSKLNLIMAEVYANNFVYDGTVGIGPIDIVEVSPDISDISVDVTSTVSSYKTSGVSIDLYDLVKDDIMFEIASKELAESDSDYFAPYIDITMNGGIKRTIIVSDDTYVVAGTKRNEVHGDETQILCEESTTSIGLTKGGMRDGKADAPVDDNTKRAKFKFVFDLSSGDSIESATLHFQAKTKLSDLAQSDAELKAAKLAIMYNGSTAWTEDACNYQKVAGYVYSWSGESYTAWNLLAEGSYRMNEDRYRYGIEQCFATAYAATKNESWAYHFFVAVMSQLESFGDYPGAFSSLDNASRLGNANHYMHMVYNSAYMTPSIFTNMLKYHWLTADYQNSKPANRNNWGATEMSGLYTTGLFFKEFVPREGCKPYCEYAISELYDTNKGMLLEDGASNELSMHYTMYGANGVLTPYGAAQSLGITDPREMGYTEAHEELLQKSMRYYMMMTAPGFVSNGHADDSRYSYSDGPLLKVGRWMNDEELIYMGTKGKEGKEPAQKSIKYESNKNGVMRTGWGENDLYCHFNVDGGVGSHGQGDDLALIIFAYGKNFLVDPLYPNDSGPIRDWMVNGTGHNTVVVDKGDQTVNNSKGTFNRWETNNAYDYINMSSTAYQGSDANRKVLFVKPGFWIVTDYIIPDDMSSEHTYDQLWHFTSDANISFDKSDMVVKTNFADAANMYVIPIDPQSIIYDDSTDYTTIDPTKSNNYDTVIKRGYNKESAIVEADYAGYGRKITGAASFSTVLYPVKRGESVETSTTVIKTDISSADAQAFSVNIREKNSGKTRNGIYYQLNNLLKKQKRKIDNYYTDGTLLYAETDDSGKLTQLISQDATAIRNTDETYLLKTKSGSVGEISLEYSANTIDISTSEDIDLENITIYGDSSIRNVKLNNENVGFNRSGKYIYFGDEPIVEDKSTSGGSTGGSSSKPSGGSGHGGGGGGGAVNGGFIGGTSKDEDPKETNEKKYEKELENHWGKNEITQLINDGIVTGNGTSLELDKNVTRAEFAAMVFRALKLDSSAYIGGFDDVAAGDWYAGYIQTLADKGMINGDGTNFYPNNNITREEMAKMAVAAYKYKNSETVSEDTGNLQFADSDEIADWAREFVDYAAGYGLIKGDTDGKFNPKNNTRRDEAMVVIYRLIKGGIAE